MADPKLPISPVTVGYIDTAPAVSQTVLVDSTHPLPVALSGGTGTTQNVNLAQVAGTATSVNSGNVDAGTQRIVLPFNQAQITNWGHASTGAAVPSIGQFIAMSDGTNAVAPKVNGVAAQLVESGPYLFSRKTADGQVKGSAGFIHTVCISGITATPTAGLITIYDSTTETGTIVYSEWVFATVVGHSVLLDVPTTNGIFVGYDGSATNIAVTVTYR